MWSAIEWQVGEAGDRRRHAIFKICALMSRENDAEPNWRDRFDIARLARARLELPSLIAMFDSNNRQP